MSMENNGNISALERFKIALQHKLDVKRQIENEYEQKGEKVNVVFL